jgi:hypothetical protein
VAEVVHHKVVIEVAEAVAVAIVKVPYQQTLIILQDHP